MAIAAKPLPATQPSDPLLAAINLYLFAGEAYDDLPDNLSEEEESEAFKRLCSDPDAVLVAWNSPATTYEGAMAAMRLLRQVLDESHGEPIAKSLLAAILPYFEGTGAR